MIVYNMTVKVDQAIANEWMQWMLQQHIPHIMQTGCFTSHHILRLLEVDDSEGPTYAVQFRCASKADYDKYIEKHAPALRQTSAEKWGQRFIAFRSLMEEVH